VAPAADPVNLWLPESGADLSMYKAMISRGHIRPFQMPEGVERLAERVSNLMETAEETGRTRDALKAAEILRLLAADNRAIGIELDRIQRLDAGKPTSITGQADPEQIARIKKIISTQKARANTEARDVGGTGSPRQPGGGGGDAIWGHGGAAQGGVREDHPRGDDPLPADDRGAGAQDRSPGEER
jgi:hypothetical protein